MCVYVHVPFHIIACVCSLPYFRSRMCALRCIMHVPLRIFVCVRVHLDVCTSLYFHGICVHVPFHIGICVRMRLLAWSLLHLRLRKCSFTCMFPSIVGIASACDYAHVPFYICFCVCVSFDISCTVHTRA